MLREEEQRIIDTSRTIRSRDPIDAVRQLHSMAHASLDALDRLPNDNVASQAQIRRTITRCAFRTFVAHPLGLPFARQLLMRSQGYGIDPDALGRMVRRFRYAQADGTPWALAGETTQQHGEIFSGFLGHVLTRLETLEADVFTQVMDIHVDNGMAPDALRALIEQCMALRPQWRGRWTPAAYQVMIQAYRRDSDIRSCVRVYEAFRESTRQGGRDEAWDRYVGETVSWPYEALLAACLDKSRVVKARYRAPGDMPQVIWRDLQEDGVDPPPRLVAYLMKLARRESNIQAGLRLWETYPRIDIDCTYQYLALIRHAPAVPLRRVIRQILESKITASQPAARVRALWNQALVTALAPPRHDFPLARWILGRFAADEHAIDAAAEQIIRYAKAKPRGTAWMREVFDVEPEPEQRKEREKKKAPMGIRNRNARSRGCTTADWDAISRRLRDLGGTQHGGPLVALPLTRPYARWDPAPGPYLTKIVSQDGGVDLGPLRRGLVAMLERCVMARPNVGVVWPGSTPGAALRAAKEGVYRDLFGMK